MIKTNWNWNRASEENKRKVKIFFEAGHSEAWGRWHYAKVKKSELPLCRPHGFNLAPRRCGFNMVKPRIQPSHIVQDLFGAGDPTTCWQPKVAILIRKSQPVKKSKHRELQITALIIVVFECHGLRRPRIWLKINFFDLVIVQCYRANEKKKKKKKN
jgi:hypothetical protein